MKCKLLVLDIDGTLTNSKKEVTPYTKSTLHRLQKSGVKIALASGRPTFGIMPVVNELELQKYGGFILSFNGGKIVECGSNKVIYEKTIPDRMICKLYDLSVKHKVNIMTYQNIFLITETPNNIYVKKEAMINQMKIKKVNSFVDYVNFPVTKCLMVENGNYLAQVEKEIKAEVDNVLSIYRSEPFFLEIMPQNIDKASSLKKLLEYLSISNDEMVACGDGYNDQTMIEYAGFGVAMENAQDTVKKVADFIAPTNDEDGVAYVVNNFILQNVLNNANEY